FDNRGLVWVISVAPENDAAPPRCQASIDRARRLTEARPPWRSPQGSVAHTDPFSIYTLHRHELVHRGFKPNLPTHSQLEACRGAALARCGIRKSRSESGRDRRRRVPLLMATYDSGR